MDDSNGAPVPSEHRETHSNGISLLGPAIEAVTILLAVSTPLALGGVHRPTILVAALLASFLVFLLWLQRRATQRGIRLTWFGIVLLGATGYTALQMLPLPVSLLRVIAPASVEVLELSLAGAGGMPGWHPISLDPGATLLETLKIGTCALAFIVAHNYYCRRRRRERLLVALVAGGVVATLLGFVGAVVAPGRPLMLYVPDAGRTSGLIATSFVNPNHGSAFLSLCALISVGLAVMARDLQQRVLLGLGGVLLGAGVFLTLSRGGILALAFGLGVLALLLVLPAPVREDRPRSAAALVPGALALILALSGWLAFEAIVSEFRHVVPELSSNLGKISLWSPGLSMALANPWVGVGRGAFAATFTRYLAGEMPRTVTYTHLENQYLHLPAELGFPIGAGLILASAVALYLWFKRSRRDPQAAALAAGFLALGGHALLDFNLETLGVALPAAILAGLLSAGDRGGSTGEEPLPASSRPTREHNRGKVRTGAVAGAALILLVVTIRAVAWPSPSAAQDLHAISATVQKGSQPEQVMRAVKDAIRRHPADAVFPLVAGRLLLHGGRPESLAWLNRATFLYPGSPQVHLDTAGALQRFGRRRQALFEYRLSLENGAPISDVLRRALPLGRTAEEAELSLPANPSVHAAAIIDLIRVKRLGVARGLAEHARSRWPHDVSVASAEVELLLAAKEGAKAEAAARALAQASPLAETYLLWARAVGQAGRPGEDISVILEGRRRYPADESFSFALGEAYLRARQFDRACAVAEEILGSTSLPSSLARAHGLLARIHLANGRPHRARYEVEQAEKIRQGR